MQMTSEVLLIYLVTDIKPKLNASNLSILVYPIEIVFSIPFVFSLFF